MKHHFVPCILMRTFSATFNISSKIRATTSSIFDLRFAIVRIPYLSGVGIQDRNQLSSDMFKK